MLQIVFTRQSFEAHIEQNMHDPPSDTLKDAVGKLLSKNLGEQITNIHTHLVPTVSFDIPAAMSEDALA